MFSLVSNVLVLFNGAEVPEFLRNSFSAKLIDKLSGKKHYLMSVAENIQKFFTDFEDW